MGIFHGHSIATSSPITTVCVCRVFIFKDTGVQPHLSVGLISVRQKGGLPGPPVTVHPRDPVEPVSFT